MNCEYWCPLDFAPSGPTRNDAGWVGFFEWFPAFTYYSSCTSSAPLLLLHLSPSIFIASFVNEISCLIVFTLFRFMLALASYIFFSFLVHGVIKHLITPCYTMFCYGRFFIFNVFLSNQMFDYTMDQ